MNKKQLVDAVELIARGLERARTLSSSTEAQMSTVSDFALRRVEESGTLDVWVHGSDESPMWVESLPIESLLMTDEEFEVYRLQTLEQGRRPGDPK